MPSPDARPLDGPVVLVVLDGWGHAPPTDGNAVTSPGVTHLPALAGQGSSCLLEASGRAVGLPEGIMGNSEVGHLTLGAGRVVDQDLVRITEACRTGSIAQLPEFHELVRATRAGSGRLHLLGLCSAAGVHSDLAHLETLARAASVAGITRILVHAFTDGRDTPPCSAPEHVARLERALASISGASLSTLGGRYYGMDRDGRWDRIERAVRCLLLGEGPRAESGLAAVARAHEQGVTDEFILPTVIDPDGALRDGDAVLFTNFRADRARQLTRAVTQPGFSEFPVRQPRLARFTCLTTYDARLGLPVLFLPQQPERTLGEEFARAGWPQLRLAETEKYAHVTYFFNGGREEPFAFEERILVPSPRVATYDLAPAMAAEALTEHAEAFLRKGGRRLLVMNYANADMVGHTGVLEATREACRIVDACVGRVAHAARKAGALLAITADHGNAECMVREDGGPLTSHTTLKVPFILAWPAGDRPGPLRAGGGLADVAPTLLELAGLDIPEPMTGRSLVTP